MFNLASIVRALTLLLCAGLTLTAPRLDAAEGKTPATASAQQPSAPDMAPLVRALEKADFHATPEVIDAYLRYRRAETEAALSEAGDAVPKEFLDWIDSDRNIALSVYGIRKRPDNIVRILRSLDLDLGAETVREEYTQLALAMAVTYCDKKDLAALGVDLTPREPITLVIPDDPREPVDTKDPNRELDAQDHIINFLNDHKTTDKKRVKVDGEVKVVETPRPLIAADVIRPQNTELQEQFTAYMAEKGHPEIKIDRRIRHWQSNAAVMFHDAYVAKGLMPRSRDALPTLSESMAWLVRNDRFQLPPDSPRKRPNVALKERPWATMTFLAQSRLPLRELEDMWQNWLDTGRPTRGGVPYVGRIAGKPWILRGVRLAPIAFYYGSAQMHVRDGGVCGAQAKTWMMTQLALGRPATIKYSSTHCGKSAFDYNPETGIARFGGGKVPQPWVFTDPAHGVVISEPHFGTAAGVTYDWPGYLESFAIRLLYKALPEDLRAAKGRVLLTDAVLRNPFNHLVSETLAKDFSAIDAYNVHKTVLTQVGEEGLNKKGCSPRWYRLPVQLALKMQRGPIPDDPAAQRELYTWLRDTYHRPHPAALLRYRAAIEGTQSMLSVVEKELRDHLAGARTPTADTKMADRIHYAARQIADVDERRAWARKLHGIIEGKEAYLFSNGRRVIVDRSVNYIYHWGALGKPVHSELIDEVLAERIRTAQELAKKESIPVQDLRRLHGSLFSIMRQIKDDDQREIFRDAMLTALGERADFADLRRMIAKRGWKVVDFSLQAHGGAAVYALDGNPRTIWNTPRGKKDAGGLPQHMSVDMGEAKTLTGFTYMPRVRVKAAMVDACAFYTSMDGETWTLAAEAKFGPELSDIADHNEAERRVSCEPVRARYFKFVVTGAMEQDNLAVAEVGVIETHDESLVREVARRQIQPTLDAVAAEWRQTILDGHDAQSFAAGVKQIIATLDRIIDDAQRQAWRGEMIAALGDGPEFGRYRRQIAKAGWKIVEASGHGRRGYAAYAIDGNHATLWHTYGAPADQGGLPQHVTVDMGDARSLSGFTYTPRIKIASGMVLGCEFYTSTDGETWTLAAKGKFDPEMVKIATYEDAERHVTFPAVKARYFKFVVTDVVTNDHLAVSEVGVIETGVGAWRGL